MNLRNGAGAKHLTLPALMVSIPFSFPHEASMAPFLNEIAADLNLSTGVAGQLGTATYLGGITAALALAPMIGQMAIRRVLVTALFIVAGTSIVSGVVDNFAALLLIRLIAGSAAGIVLAATLAAIARAWTDPKTRVVRTGLVIGAMSSGPGIFAPGLRVLGEFMDWQAGLLVYGTVTAIVALFVAFGLPSLPGSPSGISYKNRLAEAGRAVGMPVVRTVLGMRLISQVMFGVVFSFLAAFFVDLHPGREGWIAPMFFVGPFGFMQAAFVGGPLLARFGVMRTTSLAIMLTGATVFVFVWFAPSPYFSAFLFFLYGLLMGVAQTGMTALIYQHSGDRLGAAVFVNSAMGPGGSMLGAVLGGIAILAAPGYDGYKGFVTVVAVGMMAISMWLAIRTRRGGERVPVS
ncbi:MAG: MFS transporter [Chloroflexi bacterium]|jgi:MFS transporter, DHA1 family, putative efflux transporter|nr:MFS transporter [Chloroflexota bacterium]MBT4074799.1 MFS transporter [Chloroflexota bacterium]MBT4515962.1 MFS transporter [Chloroflexota bacterium]MBT5320605.1 MFS transporter [Chloroflexota bacterium]